MASLVSPGVSISVTDESFYASVGTGTVPLIIVATEENKTSSDGAGIAAYTTPENAGKVFNISSQRELLINYGNPKFYTSGGTPLHGYELNEYGLEAARSYLGFANRAYVLRADIDLAKLAPSATAPTQPPADGQCWLDINNTTWGIKRRVSGEWVLQNAVVVPAADITSDGVPTTAFGVRPSCASIIAICMAELASVLVRYPPLEIRSVGLSSSKGSTWKAACQR